VNPISILWEMNTVIQNGLIFQGNKMGGHTRIVEDNGIWRIMNHRDLDNLEPLTKQ